MKKQKDVCLLPFISFDTQLTFGPLEILNIEQDAGVIKEYDSLAYNQITNLQTIFKVGYTKDSKYFSCAILNKSFESEGEKTKHEIQTGIKLIGYFFASRKGRYNSTFIDHFDSQVFTLPKDMAANDSVNFRSRYMSMNVVETDKVIIADPYYAPLQTQNNTHLYLNDKKFISLENLYKAWIADALKQQEIILSIDWMNHALKANPNITKEMYLLFAFTAIETLLNVGRPNRDEGKAQCIYRTIQELFDDPVEIDGLLEFLKDLCSKRNDIIHDGKILDEFNYAKNNNYFDICLKIFNICLFQRLYDLGYYQGDIRYEHAEFLKYELESTIKDIDDEGF